MIVKSVLKEDLLTLAEVKEILDEVKSKRASEAGEEELGYELRRAIRHADLFAKGTAEESRRMVTDLLKLEKITPEIAVKIADLRPRTKDELRALYAKERFTLSEEELDAILDVVLRA
jgi:DNA-directed RNA polymerase subunit F